MMTRSGEIRSSTSKKQFNYAPLEARKLLSASQLFGGLTELDSLDADRINQSFVVSGDPNGTPAASPSSIIDPNVSTSAFAGVVSINPVGDDFSSLCSGTLISSTHVLTAAHCFDANDNGQSDANPEESSVVFNSGGSPFAIGIESVELHPDFTGFNRPSVNDDLAIITLEQAAPDSVPIYEINRDAFVSPERIVISGFGRSGTGVDGFTTGASFTTRRVGENVASAFFSDDEGSGSREVFVFDFDGPTGSTNSLGDGLSLGNDVEVTIGGGDSGGPSFLFDDLNNNGNIDQGELTLFGVNTFGTSLPGRAAPFFGSQAGGIVVSSYLDFIDSQINDVSEERVIGFSTTITIDSTFERVEFGRSFVNPVVVAGPLSTNGGQATTVRIRNVDSTGFEIRAEEYDFLDQVHVEESVSILVLEAGVHELEDGTLIQAGNISQVNHTFTRTTFSESFDLLPVVLTQVTTQNGGSTVTPRLQAVNRNSFSVRLQEQEAADNVHSFEEVSYVAIERGTGIAGGLAFDSQITGVNQTHLNREVTFRNDFDTRPNLFGNIQTTLGGDTVGLRYRSLDADSTTLFAQEEQSADAEVFHVAERVGLLAIDTGLLRGRTVQSSSPTGNSADAGFVSVSEDAGFGVEFFSRVSLSVNLTPDVDTANVAQPRFQIASSPTLQLQAVDADLVSAFGAIDRVFETGFDDDSESDDIDIELNQFDISVG